jgi:ABC-type antimicrobial peptide transport system permease subunit
MLVSSSLPQIPIFDISCTTSVFWTVSEAIGFPATPTWGNMLRNAQTYMTRAPWTAIFPGLMIFIAVIAINFIGDGLRDALDPYKVET